MSEQANLHSLCVEKIDVLSSTTDGDIDYFDISSVDNENKKIISHQTMRAQDAPSRAKQLVRTGDILVSTVRPNLNAVAMVDRNTGNTMVASTGFCVLRANEKADPHYLFHFVQSSRFVDVMVSQATGASYPAVSNSIVKNCSIPLPDLPTQRRIAATLDKVSEGIDLCRKMLGELDVLVKARFVEMFGDPTLNQHGWKKIPLRVNATLLNGRAYKQDELLDSGKYPVLRVGNFFSNREWYYSDLELDEEKYCDDGDLLYAWSASFGPQIWNGGKVIYHYHIWKVLVGDAYNKLFLCKLLEYSTESLMGDTHGIAMMHLTKAGMENTEFIVPPIELQVQFAVFVEQADKSKFAIQQQLSALETLKKSLMQEYFG